jgi:TetR/AcrR family transcriptional regulator, transcriptional repressor of bet genes
VNVASRKKARPQALPTLERASRVRQRRRLIDACISALHSYGPSRTTVQKVVAIAGMSPGIVRFYFDSKAAMMIASLQFLAAEFEQRVLVPVAELREQPVRALETLVELYLDPDIASPRKVSVWYAFWGEASSRQEYYDICGQKDERFADLVRELIARVISETGADHLDPDAVALGLIGVLEMLWQGFAFQVEANIDRSDAKRRCMAYLRSVFPRRFAARATLAPGAGARRGADAPEWSRSSRLPAWAYANVGLFELECERLIGAAWQVAGHARQLPSRGDFLTLELQSLRVLLVRDEAGAIRAFRNTCRHRPHALVSARAGRFTDVIECTVHGLAYRFDGTVIGPASEGDLHALGLLECAGLLCVRAAARVTGKAEETPAGLRAWERPAASLVAPADFPVAADWKILIEQWLEFSLAQRLPRELAGLVEAPTARADGGGGIDWQARIVANGRGWTAAHYARLVSGSGPAMWQRVFVHPNQLVEIRPDGACILQVLPQAPGRCILRRFDATAAPATRGARALAYLGRRLLRTWLRQDSALAESTQAGLAGMAAEMHESGSVPLAVAAFRRSVAALITGGEGAGETAEDPLS